MNEKTLATVFLISYYNCELLVSAVEKIVKQDYPRIELIISDDGTPDYSKERMEEDVQPYVKYFERVVINKNIENEGTVKHLNRVINLAKGEIICGIGIDDSFVDEHTISDIVEYFDKNKDVDVVTSKRYEESISRIKPSKFVIRMLEENQVGYRTEMFRITPQICNIGTFYRKRCFEKNGLYPEEFFLVEDAPYVSYLVANNVKIAWMDKVTTIHAAGGVTCKGKKRKQTWYDDRIYLYEKWLPQFVEKRDWFSFRCLKFHSRRSRANTIGDLLISFGLYMDVCLYLFIKLGVEALKEGRADINSININKKIANRNDK